MYFHYRQICFNDYILQMNQKMHQQRHRKHQQQKKNQVKSGIEFKMFHRL